MAQLPDALPLDPVEGAPVSHEVVQPTDFGLGQVAQDFQNLDTLRMHVRAGKVQAQKLLDLQAVGPQLADLQSANETDFKTAVAADAAGQPGFVGDLYGRLTERVNRAASLDGLTPGQATALRTAGITHANAIANAAASAHADALAAPIAEATKATRTFQVGEGLTAFSQSFDPAVDELQRNFVAGDPDIVAKTGQLFDNAAGAAVAAAPPAAQPQLQLQLVGQRAKAMGDALDFQLKHTQDAALQSVSRQFDAIANTVASAPSAYDNAVAVSIPQAVAALPRGLQAAGTADAMAQIAQARVKALISAGDAGQAQGELNDGRYDQWLKPAEKESLLSEADAAGRDRAPRSLDQAQAQLGVKQKADAEITGILTNGKGVDLTPAELKTMPYAEQAQYLAGATRARQVFAAAGAVRDMPIAALQGLAHGSGPDPTAPDYAQQLPIFEAQQKLAQQELAARQKDPGGWAWASNGKGAVGKGAGTAAISVAVDRGAALQQMWGGVTNAQGQARQSTGARYAGTMLGSQYAAGVPADARQIVPDAEAARLAATVVNAPPEGRLKAIQDVAHVLNSLPASMRLPDGSTASPQGLLQRQLLAAHLPAGDVSAIVDFGGQPAALGRYVAAVNNPQAAKPLDGAQERTLRLSVTADLAPELKASAPLPGAEALNQARIDRSTLIARSLVIGGMAPEAAARSAAADVTGGRRYVDTWSMPASLAGGLHFAGGNLTDSAGLVSNGAARVMQGLTANHGANLYSPPGNLAYAAAVAAHGRWVTEPGDGGLALMTPKTDGTWQQAADKWGRPIVASWDDLKAVAGGKPSPFAAPPPPAPASTAVTHAGAPMPAFSRQAAFTAIVHSIETQESHGVSGQISKPFNGMGGGAYGVRQVLPATAAPYAQRLFGQPLDLGRLLHDDAYNRKIGNAIVADSINHYGNTPGGVVLVLADYIEGRGNIEGHTDAQGYHPGLIQKHGDPRSGANIDAWIAALPPNGRAYVQRTLPRALAYLATGQ